MKGWTLLNTYTRIHQAELRKSVLAEYEINAVIINEKDSTFLWGDIELWVEDLNLERAKILLAEFEGWTKIDSFLSPQQLKRLEQQLNLKQIETKIVKRENYYGNFPEYELFVKNEDSIQASEIMNRLEGWAKIEGFENLIQAAYRVEKLENHDVETIVINKRDDNFLITEVEVYVKDVNKEKAEILISKFEGWNLVDEFSDKIKAELAEGELERNNIEFIDFQRKDTTGKIEKIELYTREQEVENAKLIIDQSKTWTQIKSFVKLYNAQLYKEILDEANIYNVLINTRDNSFLWGEIYLYVEEDNVEKAQTLFQEFEAANPIPEESEEEQDI